MILIMIRKHTFIIYEMINESKQVFIIVLIKETIVICYAITKQLIRKRVRHDWATELNWTEFELYLTQKYKNILLYNIVIKSLGFMTKLFLLLIHLQLWLISGYMLSHQLNHGQNQWYNLNSVIRCMDLIRLSLIFL